MEILKWTNVVEPGEKFHIARAKRTTRHSVPPHGHDFAEVFWIDTGIAIHTVNGQSFTMNVGDLFFIRPGDIHSIEPPHGEAFQLTNLAFSAEVLEDFRTRYFSCGDFAWWTKNPQPATEKLTTEQLARLNRWADEMTEAPRDIFWLHRFLLNLLHQLRPCEYSHITVQNAPQWLQHACREMQKPENLIKGLDAFFALCGRSREHAARSMRQSCGLSPTEFLQGLRLQRAARQLETSNKEILAIAFDCGFENISHFYRLFQKQFGQTPKSYRKRRQLF